MRYPTTRLLPVAVAAALGLASTAEARVTRIVIDSTTTLPASGAMPEYTQLRGRAFGELDPQLAQNAIIQDIEAARDADGVVRYYVSFQLVYPSDRTLNSGLICTTSPIAAIASGSRPTAASPATCS
jgi:hypothetical protein